MRMCSERQNLSLSDKKLLNFQINACFFGVLLQWILHVGQRLQESWEKWKVTTGLKAEGKSCENFQRVQVIMDENETWKLFFVFLDHDFLKGVFFVDEQIWIYHADFGLKFGWNVHFI